MNCEGSIVIRAKGCGREATVSLRQKELIRNLRALVAVRFEQAIARIVLVFAGQVLRDVGTIDSKGIVSGVTVHVVCRAEVPDRTSPTSSPVTINITKTPAVREGLMRSLYSANMAYFGLNEPGVLRNLLQADPRIRSLIEENATMRHYLNSDQNLREMLSMAFSPAKKELGRRRDLYISRLEFVPGGYRMLGRLNYFMLQAYEDNVAMSFQQASQGAKGGSNPQRGRENKDPLPNPWRRSPRTPRTPGELRGMGIFAGRIPVNQSGSGSSSDSDSGLDGSQEKSQKRPTTSAPQIKRADSPRREEGRWDWCYKVQLEQLVQMGYQNRNRNIRALLISLGNVDSAARLLDHWDRSVEK